MNYFSLFRILIILFMIHISKDSEEEWNFNEFEKCVNKDNVKWNLDHNMSELALIDFITIFKDFECPEKLNRIYEHSVAQIISYSLIMFFRMNVLQVINAIKMIKRE